MMRLRTASIRRQVIAACVVCAAHVFVPRAAADAVLWNNGPIVNAPFAGAGGAHASRVQSELGLTLVGFGGAYTVGTLVTSSSWLADDFVVDTPGGWNVTSVDVHTMPQVGLTPPPVPPDETRISVWILSAPPWEPSTVLFQGGAAGPFPQVGTYRVPGNNLGDTTLPIDRRTVPINVILAPGHYWLMVELDHNAYGLKSQAPPVTRNGQTVTGDAWEHGYSCHWVFGCHDSPWAPIDPTQGVGLPFVVKGQPAAARKGDFDGQAGPDLVLRNVNPSSPDFKRHQLWLMNGTTQASTAFVSPDPAAGAAVVAADDFDTAGAPWNGPDGKADLLFQDATGAVEFWLMDGAQRLGAPLPLSGTPRSLDWVLAASADFGHDAHPDLLWRNLATQKLEIWSMVGTVPGATLVPSPDQALDGNWVVVAAQDYNGDGSADLLWYNATSGRVVSWYMDAALQRISGQFLNPASVADNNWKVLASGDYSRAQVPATPPFGSPDVVWRNETSGRLVVWHLDFAGNRVAGEFTSPMSATPALDWTVVGPR